MSNTINSDVQKLNLGSDVTLFIIDTSVIGGSDIFHFHSGVNILGNNVVWQGVTYTRYPLSAVGYELSGKGILPRPSLTVANVSGAFSALCNTYQDMLGTKITRKKTLLKYLDAVNFAGGVNPTADPDSHYADEVHFINRKTGQNQIAITFELVSSWDVTGQKLPRRQIIKNACPWVYRGADCGYAGSSYWDVNDLPVGTLVQDVCGKRLNSCKLRFGALAELPYGGMPGATL